MVSPPRCITKANAWDTYENACYSLFPMVKFFRWKSLIEVE